MNAASVRPPEPIPGAGTPRLVVLISGRGSNLRSIVAATRDGSLPATVAGVVANRPEASGLAWAADEGIATRAVDHRGFADRAEFDAALDDTIDALAPVDGQNRPWVVLAGFMRVLGERFVQRYAGRLVNIHPSLLPLYPGLHTHRRAIEDRALMHGATVHLVTPALDHGPIVAQAAVPVLAGDDEDRLAARVLALEHRLYPQALRWLVQDRVTVRDGRVLIDDADAVAGRLLLDPSFLADPGLLVAAGQHASTESGSAA